MAARADTNRLHLLAALDARPHRFTVRRRFTIAFSLAVLFAVPLSGLVGVDAWASRHVVVGARSDGVTAVAAALTAIWGLYLATFVVNVGFGRLFCGFGCPAGAAWRLGDAAHGRGARGRLELTLFSLVLSAALLSWWVSPEVLVEGSARARAWTLGVLFGSAALVGLAAVRWRWRACQLACPIGLYYTAIRTSQRFGVQASLPAEGCGGCHACARACPVGLDPRDLAAPRPSLGGLMLDGFPGRNHCLVCGDCVRACELVFAKHPEDGPRLRLGRPSA